MLSDTNCFIYFDRVYRHLKVLRGSVITFDMFCSAVQALEVPICEDCKANQSLFSMTRVLKKDEAHALSLAFSIEADIFSSASRLGVTLDRDIIRKGSNSAPTDKKSQLPYF